MQVKNLCRLAVTLLLSGLAGVAQAHTGQGTSLLAGLSHPLGLDHLLAMLAVGVWSISALPSGKVWQGPATFLLVLLAGVIIGFLGVGLPYLEQGLALSLVLFGLLIANRALPKAVGLGLVASAAALHGLAHGSEAPAAGFAGYLAALLFSTTVLHLGGLGIGLAIKQRALLLGSLGSALGVAGLYLFGQLAA